VAAFRAALDERTRARVPLEWATTQNNLGIALTALGERENGTARLEEAVAAFAAALEEYTPARAPLHWATAQNNLGVALQRLGETESDTSHLEKAIIAYRAALEERTRERAPLQWAATLNNLATVLATLEEAVATFRSALEVYEEAKADFYVESARKNLTRAEALLAERRKQTSK
jgi:tetratricopeptide (TPR) repeat protein